MAYRRVVLDLTTVIDAPVAIESRDSRIGEVIVTRFPADTVIALHFGQTSDAISIDAPISFQPTGEESNNGLFWTNPVAKPGVTVDVIVVLKQPAGGLRPADL